MVVRDGLFATSLTPRRRLLSHCSGAHVMANKGTDQKKEAKRKPAKTMKEKRADKATKKASRSL